MRFAGGEVHVMHAPALAVGVDQVEGVADLLERE
jgi:hypothetical protein